MTAMLDRPPQVVFFDVDHTLIRGSSGAYAARVLARRRLIRHRDVARALAYTALHRLGRAPVDWLFREAAAAFRGLDLELIREVAEETFELHLAAALYRDGQAQVEAHLKKGDRVVLLSAGPDLVIERLARALGVAEVIASTGVVGADGCFTGEIRRPYCYGEGKVALASRFLEGIGRRLDETVFYSDSVTDLPMLAAVATPRVVNPDRPLGRIARNRGWQVLRFSR